MSVLPPATAVAPTRLTAVAFLFFSESKDWHGGKNYYRALFGALDADPARRIRVLAFVGKRIDTSGFDFPSSVTFVRSSALDRHSPAWFVDQIGKLLFSRTPILQRRLRREGTVVVSHGDPRNSSTFPTIAWIPDFQHVRLPRFFQPNELTARNAQFKATVDGSERVVVSSHAACGDLIQFSPGNAGKARVLQFCSARPELPANGGEDLTLRYGLAATFFYLPNQFWAHKNHRLALEALALVRTRWPQAQIVCSGALSDYRNPTHIEALRARVDELGLQDGFKLLGLLPYDHVAQLILRSAAVINPSYFEGWSTTVEEAKSLGAPLLLSDIPVHREQCPAGEALFFPADDGAALARCMERVLVGEWPPAVADRVAAALARHQARTIAFSQAYQSIVDELTTSRRQPA